MLNPQPLTLKRKQSWIRPSWPATRPLPEKEAGNSSHIIIPDKGTGNSSHTILEPQPGQKGTLNTTVTAPTPCWSLSLKRAQATAPTPCWPLPEKGTDHIRYLAFLCQMPWPYKTKDRGITGRLPFSWILAPMPNIISGMIFPIRHLSSLCLCRAGSGLPGLQPGPSLKRAQATAPTPY
jgi:hypothetical protein